MNENTGVDSSQDEESLEQPPEQTITIDGKQYRAEDVRRLNDESQKWQKSYRELQSYKDRQLDQTRQELEKLAAVRQQESGALLRGGRSERPDYEDYGNPASYGTGSTYTSEGQPVVPPEVTNYLLGEVERKFSPLAKTVVELQHRIQEQLTTQEAETIIAREAYEFRRKHPEVDDAMMQDIAALEQKRMERDNRNKAYWDEAYDLLEVQRARAEAIRKEEAKKKRASASMPSTPQSSELPSSPKTEQETDAAYEDMIAKALEASYNS